MSTVRRNLIQALHQSCVKNGISIEVESDIRTSLLAVYDEEITPRIRTAKDLKESTIRAAARGAQKNDAITSAVETTFRIHANWQRRDWQALLDFLKSRPEGETIERFAAWWKTTFMGKDGLPPSNPDRIMYYWPQAFEQSAADTGRVDADGGFYA